MTNDSELENLQCHPFHWPEREIFVDGEAISYIVKLEEIPPHWLRQFYQGEWDAGDDAEIAEELLDVAGIPRERGGDDAMGI